MTASTDNARRSLALLRHSVEAVSKELGHERILHLMNSVEKCLESLASQVSFYEGIKSPLRSIVVQHPNGFPERISAMELKALRLADTPHTLYGSSEALAALAAQLARLEDATPCQTSSASTKTDSSTK
ncbi:hypothetical protein DYI23_05935 [Roseibium polysiphoniae]|uniref:Uncharacterized protein n=1 Tax=Roseibium polysiphoniae TaxID=2571221 RepID=A0A944CB56_9HYPH|nr:hypothetical protein [Roseibium polysiphoniae]MBS8259754.1 hypothetical protein [Roseibium polysiphoniae]